MVENRVIIIGVLDNSMPTHLLSCLYKNKADGEIKIDHFLPPLKRQIAHDVFYAWPY